METTVTIKIDLTAKEQIKNAQVDALKKAVPDLQQAFSVYRIPDLPGQELRRFYRSSSRSERLEPEGWPVRAAVPAGPGSAPNGGLPGPSAAEPKGGFFSGVIGSILEGVAKLVPGGESLVQVVKQGGNLAQGLGLQPPSAGDLAAGAFGSEKVQKVSQGLSQVQSFVSNPVKAFTNLFTGGETAEPGRVAPGKNPDQRGPTGFGQAQEKLRQVGRLGQAIMGGEGLPAAVAPALKAGVGTWKGAVAPAALGAPLAIPEVPEQTILGLQQIGQAFDQLKGKSGLFVTEIETDLRGLQQKSDLFTGAASQFKTLGDAVKNLGTELADKLTTPLQGAVAALNELKGISGFDWAKVFQGSETLKNTSEWLTSVVTSLKELNALAGGGSSENVTPSTPISDSNVAAARGVGQDGPKQKALKGQPTVNLAQTHLPAVRGGDTIYNQQRNYNFFSGGLTSELLARLK